jgi:hypothetical protein
MNTDTHRLLAIGRRKFSRFRPKFPDCKNEFIPKVSAFSPLSQHESHSSLQQPAVPPSFSGDHRCAEIIPVYPFLLELPTSNYSRLWPRRHLDFPPRRSCATM